MSSEDSVGKDVRGERETRPWTMLSAIGGWVSEVSDGYACGQLPLSEMVMQPTRVFHAGAIVVLADEVASAAIYGGATSHDTLLDRSFPYSIQLSTNLISNDPVGPLTAEAQVVKRGRIVVVDTEVHGHDGRLVALFRSTHVMVDLKKVGPHRQDKLPGQDG